MSVFAAIERRASKLSGGHPSNPSYWVAKLFGGGTAASTGITVDEDSALTYSAVWAAINIISGGVAFLPLHTYRRLAPRGKERAPDHPVYKLLHDRPNPYMGALSFRECLQAHALLWGNGYAEIEQNGAGRPLALWPLPPQRVECKVVKGKLVYAYRKADEQTAIALRADQVLHIHGLGFDGLKGYSVISYARETIGLGLGTEKFGAKFFANGANAGGVLQHPGSLSDKAWKHLRESLETAHAGLDEAHRLMILEEGMQWEKTGVPPEDAQFLQTRTFQVDEVARWFDIAPHMLKQLSRATFSNIEHQGIEFVVWCLGKWLRRWEEESDYKMFSEAERKEYFAEFLTAALLKGDTATRYAAYEKAINTGWMNRNEARDAENLNPADGLDEFIVPLNMSKVGEPEPEGEEPKVTEPAKDTEEEEKGERFRALVFEAWRRIIKREVGGVRKLMVKHTENRALDDAMGEFYVEHAAHIQQALEPILRAYCGSGAASREIAVAHITDAAAQLKDTYNGGSVQNVTAAVEALLRKWELELADQRTNELLGRK